MFGQRCNRQHRVGQVELVVLEVQGIAGFVILPGLRLEFFFFALLVCGQLSVVGNGLVVHGLLACRPSGLGQFELHDGRVGDSSRMLRAW
ncbi:hypothetical protein [Pseudoduganella sp. HUAS MS19]